jgi:hypothetical protein
MKETATIRNIDNGKAGNESLAKSEEKEYHKKVLKTRVFFRKKPKKAVYTKPDRPNFCPRPATMTCITRHPTIGPNPQHHIVQILQVPKTPNQYIRIAQFLHLASGHQNPIRIF